VKIVQDGYLPPAALLLMITAALARLVSVNRFGFARVAVA
jgi:hypothetical protein